MKRGSPRDQNRMSSDVDEQRRGLLANQEPLYNNTDKINGTHTHKRTKRFLSYPRYVEVMVVADNKMVEYHGANLQHYVLTLMSIVSIFLFAVGLFCQLGFMLKRL